MHLRQPSHSHLLLRQPNVSMRKRHGDSVVMVLKALLYPLLQQARALPALRNFISQRFISILCNSVFFLPSSTFFLHAVAMLSIHICFIIRPESREQREQKEFEEACAHQFKARPVDPKVSLCPHFLFFFFTIRSMR